MTCRHSVKDKYFSFVLNCTSGFLWINSIHLITRSPNTPRLLPNLSLVFWSCAVKLLHCIRGWRLVSSFKDILSLSCSLLNEWILSQKLHQSDLASLTHKMFCLLCACQRYFFVHIPPHKGKTFLTTTSVWFYFMHINIHILAVKNIPKCFNKVNKLWWWKYTCLLIIYFY